MSSPVDPRPDTSSSNAAKPTEASHSAPRIATVSGVVQSSEDSHTMVDNNSIQEEKLDIRRTRSRQDEHRIMDEISVLKAERAASISMQRSSRTTRKHRFSDAQRREEGQDEVSVKTVIASHLTRSQKQIEELVELNDLPEPGEVKPAALAWTPPEKPTTSFAKVVKKVHQSSILIRYFTYIVPVALIILIPTLLGAFLFKEKTVGDVFMTWFCVWLMVVWLSLWAGRVSFVFPNLE
jgi:hypothetical protein